MTKDRQGCRGVASAATELREGEGALRRGGQQHSSASSQISELDLGSALCQALPCPGGKIT